MTALFSFYNRRIKIWYNTLISFLQTLSSNQNVKSSYVISRNKIPRSLAIQFQRKVFGKLYHMHRDFKVFLFSRQIKSPRCDLIKRAYSHVLSLSHQVKYFFLKYLNKTRVNLKEIQWIFKMNTIFFLLYNFLQLSWVKKVFQKT